jgi:hypothetical protein
VALYVIAGMKAGLISSSVRDLCMPRTPPARSRYESVLVNEAAENSIRHRRIGSGPSIGSDVIPRVFCAC